MAILSITIGLSPTLEAWVQTQTNTTVNSLARIEAAIKQQGAQFMSQITDFAAKVETNFAGIKAGIQALDEKITALQNSPGMLSASDQAALDAIVADSAALVTTANALPAVTPPAVP
jgi:hypothetical protein